MTNPTPDIAATKKSVFYGLFGAVAVKQFNFLQARFRDRETEHAYQKYLIDVELPKERLVNYLGIGIYLIFGILDVYTFDEKLNHVLILRWAICAPVAISLISLTFFDRFKMHFQYITISVMVIGSLSVVGMIGMMDPEGGPPYLIGILAIFIFYACMQRMYFLAAAAVFIGVSAAYSLTITVISPKTPEEIASGHFFMIFIASVAFFTIYMQEIRSRINFFQLRQREMDATFIEKLLIEATAADRAKISFLSILSHELRTPLHQIVGFSEVVKNQVTHDPNSDPSDYLDEIHSSATSLLTSISKMLRYADATAGKISYDAMDCSVDYLIETVIEQARSKAEQEKVTISLGEIENAKLHIDHLHTAYAIGQLLDNAIAASSQGGGVEITGGLNDDGGYRLDIIDHGCGMSQDQITAAFAPFVQTEDVKTRTMEGVGLGLSLSKKIVEDQGAALILNSEVDLGTTVSVVFPLADTKENEEGSDAA
ncbi:MAG: HAMP domain-containing sensor histidine kinase [Pseudomonadota bacterium]